MALSKKLQERLRQWKPWWLRSDKELCRAFKIKPDGPLLKEIREKAREWEKKELPSD